MKYVDYDREAERLVEPIHDELRYCGRIDDSHPDAPVFVMPGSFVRMNFTGSSWIKAVVINRRNWECGNWMGVLLNEKQSKVEITKDNEPVILTLSEDLDRDKEYMVTFFKRMDQCHEVTFLGFLLEYGAHVNRAMQLPRKRIEFYGDSVTCGEVSEAMDYIRKPDPEHNGEYNNAYFSYAWATARMLHARPHIVATGGIALMDGTGYFCDGKVGMESCYDKVYFYPQTAKVEEGRMQKWNFERFKPHVVVVAIGQNDAWPRDFMRDDMKGERAEQWRAHYKNWILSIRERYPKAWIVLTTTILFHNPGWDRSIGRICVEINDPRIVHFLYQENGRGTPGHVRVSEAMNMALELRGFIEGLSGRIWEDE